MTILLPLLISLKVVSLVPSVTEIIFLLGADSLLAGTTIYCNYPEAAKKTHKVGDLLHPKIEDIVRISPDIIFVTLPMQRSIMEKLKKLGFNVISVNPESINGILKTITLIGKYTGTSERARFVVDSLKKELQKLEKSKPAREVRVFFELSPKPLYTIGKNSFLNEIVEVAGGKNIFDYLKIPYPVVRQEDVIKENPEVIIISYPDANPENVVKRIGWDSINAVKTSCIFKVEPELFTRPGPRFILAIKRLRKIFQECILRESR